LDSVQQESRVGLPEQRSVNSVGGVRHVLGLLDMSAAFDYVDQAILLQRLRLRFGLSNDVINWICSFLSGRSQQVVNNGTESLNQPELFWCTQDSVLGPILYVLYTIDLECIVEGVTE
jgi:Reverse transcriptase (RNA-dependent DNA polymerase)